ncbi:transcriptional regulator [Planctomycetota bacterium]|nr:transcriptional regulator [Planctomycetota bacterium]
MNIYSAMALLMASNQDISDDLLALTARLYYLDRLGQSEVARMVNVSQAKVSRLLSLARERGIVQITVADYNPRATNLEQALEDNFDLKEVLVIKTFSQLKIQEIRHTIAHFSAEILSNYIQSNNTVVVAGGRSLCSVINHMEPNQDARDITVVQGMGNIDSSIGGYDAIKLGSELASKFNGNFQMLNCPVYVPDAPTCDALLALDPIKNVKQMYTDADLAFVGIGTSQNSVFADRNVVSEDDIQELGKAGAVGEMVGRFFDIDGNECDTDYRNRVISIELDEIRKIPEVVAVVAGGQRSKAILGAIKGNLVKSLVIDEDGAKTLLSLK